MLLVPHLTTPPNMPREVKAAIDTIGNQARTEILRQLSISPLTAPELAQSLGADRTSVHRHLRALESHGLVEADRPAGQRTGVTVRWSTVRSQVNELGKTWTAYANGE